MEFKFFVFLVVWLFNEISCDVKYTFPEVNYCSHLSRCEPDKCCKRYGGHIFGGIGKCEPLRLEGQACDLGCPCGPGSKCAVNPLCPTCRTICIRDEVVTSLNGYLNKACFANCKDDRLNHLFKPKTCLLKLYRNEGESCNEWCKCAPGTYCAPNILCPYCDNICMNMSTVNSLVHYFNVGCLNCNEDISPVLFTRANMRFSRLSFDANNCIVFPTLF